MERILLAGLMKAELPGHTMLLCDGGFVTWNGETYQGVDETFGTIDKFSPPEEGIGDVIPAGTLTMLPNGSASAIALSQPSFQGSRIRFWIAEINEAVQTWKQPRQTHWPMLFSHQVAQELRSWSGSKTNRSTTCYISQQLRC